MNHLFLRGTRQLFVAVAGLCLTGWGAPASAEANREGVPSPASSQHRLGDLGLRRCLELAERNFPKIHEARARRDQKASLVDVARYAPFSEFTLTGGLVTAPRVGGTAEYSHSTDVALSRNMGLAWQIGVDGALPLYTFGKMTHAVEAAEAGLRASDSEIDKERNEVRLSVRRAYFGVLLARDALVLVKEAMGKLEHQIDKLDKDVQNGEGDDIELLKLRVYRADLVGKRSEAEKQETIALSALRYLTGSDTSVDVPDVPLYAEFHELRVLSYYVEQARAHRPELMMARAAVSARKSLAQLEVSKFFPDVGLGLQARWSRAPEVTEQTNPYVKDVANFTTLSAGLVIKQKLDFLPQMARFSQARAQVAEAIATEQWAKSGIGHQVAEAFAEVRDASQKLDAFGEATRLAKQWLVKVEQGIDVGTMDEADIVEPAKEYALKRYAELQATYEYNVAFARLIQTTGTEISAADGS